MPIYTVEVDGKQYDIEGDHTPSEAEARQAVAAHTPPAAGPVERFLEPIGQAARSLAALPGAAVEAGKMIGQGRYGEMVNNVGRAIIQPQVEQARQAMNSESDIEAAGHGLAAALPVVGPAASDIADALKEGNVAGALGQGVVLGAPFLRAPEYAAKLAALLKNRSAARILGVMRPDLARAATAEQIAPEVVAGVAGREEMGGLGVGRRATLAERAKARAELATADLKNLQANTTPVNPAPISQALRDEALSKESVAPSGQTFTEDSALTDALRAHANKVDEMAAAWGGDVPAGELFKQRAVLNKKMGGRGVNGLPGDLTSAQIEAGTARNAQTSALLHDESQWGEGGLGGSKITDNEYHVMQNAYVNLERSRLRDMLGRGGKEIMQLLAGRLAGATVGGAIGFASYGPMAGIAGAALGVTLGESAYWGSLRATTYSQLAKLLRAGNIDEATNLVQRSAAAYTVDKAVRERERNRRAQQALQSQAQGVVAP
jgi:hypothetical protein